VGADGVICVGNMETSEGLTVKITSGQNPIRDIYIIHALKQLGWLTEKEASHPPLEPFTHQTIENTQGKVVGHYQCR
jgi:L-asparaginase II